MNIIIKRTLKDYDSWKKVVSENTGLRGQYGSKGARVYRSAKNPDEVYLVFEWDDSKPFANYMDRPDVKQAFEDTGTLEVIEVSESFTLME